MAWRQSFRMWKIQSHQSVSASRSSYVVAHAHVITIDFLSIPPAFPHSLVLSACLIARAWLDACWLLHWPEKSLPRSLSHTQSHHQPFPITRIHHQPLCTTSDPTWNVLTAYFQDSNLPQKTKTSPPSSIQLHHSQHGLQWRISGKAQGTPRVRQ